MNIWIKTIIQQVFPVEAPRGKLRITRFAFNKMQDYGLKEEDIADAFHYGKWIIGERMERRYRDYTIVLVVREDKAYNEHVVVTCWKAINWERR